MCMYMYGFMYKRVTSHNPVRTIQLDCPHVYRNKAAFHRQFFTAFSFYPEDGESAPKSKVSSSNVLFILTNRQKPVIQTENVCLFCALIN